jgi:lysophospholipase L1-like esterase
VTGRSSAMAWLLLVLAATSVRAQGREQRDFAGVLHDQNGDGKIVVLCFGDSITAGTIYGAYPAELRTMLKGPTVVNEGVFGETSTEGRRRLPAVLDKVGADYVVLLEGINDACKVDDVAANLSAMVAEVRGREAVPLVGTLFVSPRRERGQPARCAKQVNHRIRELPVALVDLDRAMRHRWDAFTRDGLHPNGWGCKHIAETVAGALAAGPR